DIEEAEVRELLNQVEGPELNHFADLGRDLPQLADLRKIFDQEGDRQSALDLELGIEPRPRLLQHFVGDVGREDLDSPAGDLVSHLAQAHRERVRLLSGRCRPAPDADLATGPRGQQRGHHRVAKLLERDLVAEEKGLVGGHCLDHFGNERLGRGAQSLHQGGKAGEPGLAGNGKQPAFHEILLAGGKREAGALLEHPAQELVVGGSHDEAPVKSSSSFGAMRSSGSTAAQRPARATAPGIPQTTLLASSCATTLPPARTIAAAPSAPSVPMPVRTSARAAAPQTCAAEPNKGSTAGRQKFTIGPSSSVTTGTPSRRITRMCRPPGARPFVPA